VTQISAARLTSTPHDRPGRRIDPGENSSPGARPRGSVVAARPGTATNGTSFAVDDVTCQHYCGICGLPVNRYKVIGGRLMAQHLNPAGVIYREC
jgi:hypothetical protein